MIAQTTTPPTIAPTTRPRRRDRLHGGRFGLLAVLPFAVFMLVFAAYPLVQLVRMSLSDVSVRDGVFTWDFGTLANFARIAGDATTLVSLHIRNVFFDRLELGYGAAFSLAVVVFVAVLLLVTAVVRRTVRQGEAT